MDPELMSLVTTAASTLVGRLATDGWEQVTRLVGTWWRRVRPEQAEGVEADLAETRESLAAGSDPQELVAEWRGQLKGLLRSDPQLAEELRALVQELQPEQLQQETGGTRIEMRAEASGHGTVYQAGRDQHINGR
ncbi:hypothetical protein [Kitasatospora viridis]|uniref:hypothetical protein n=1 Tax=Kitasatospora viridis TaxID=281105 RepID=UPI0031DA5086